MALIFSIGRALSKRGSFACLLASSLCCGDTLGLLAATASAANLTSTRELAELRHLADEGVEPIRSLRDKLLVEARRPWRWGRLGGRMVTSWQDGKKRCHPESHPEWNQMLVEGAPDVYAMVLGYRLTGDQELAARARTQLLSLAGTNGFDGFGPSDYSGQNQCVLELALSVPVWIESASLLEGAPGWDAPQRSVFARWLAAEVYPKVAWASRVRRNNWGAAGSLAAMLVADYVDGSVERLSEREPRAVTLTPAAASRAHREMQLERIRTRWRGDGRCPNVGIQSHGGIPDELRRGAEGCGATQLLGRDAAYAYQTMHVEALVFHAEVLRRRGDSALFDASVPGGAPAILQAILFVIDNPRGGKSWPWRVSSRGTLVVAGRYYGDARVEAARVMGDNFRGGRLRPYAPLTHAGWPADTTLHGSDEAAQDEIAGDPD